jgi:signal peptidase I
MNPPPETGASEILANLTIGMVVLIAVGLTAVRIFLLYSSAGPRLNERVEIPGWARSAAEIVESLIIAGVLVFLIIRPFFVQAFFIPSASMENTLLGHDAGTPDDMTNHTYEDTVHDHIFVNKLVYRYSKPKFTDIIVFKAPKEADLADKNNNQPQVENVLIKRLIGLPGDTIEVKNGHVIRNHVVLEEYHVPLGNSRYSIKEPMKSTLGEAHYAVDSPLTLGPDELFVMGDNRNDSNDSRFWGPLKSNRVMGKAELIFWPLDRVRLVK